MREIKFRAWDKKGCRWVTHNLGIDCHGMRYWILGYRCDPVDRDEYELMQFTGLRDKNGKEIYEGDILRLRDTRVDEDVTDIQEVMAYAYGSVLGVDISGLDEEDGIIAIGWLHTYGIEHEVIGNIHENPELMK